MKFVPNFFDRNKNFGLTNIKFKEYEMVRKLFVFLFSYYKIFNLTLHDQLIHVFFANVKLIIPFEANYWSPLKLLNKLITSQIETKVVVLVGSLKVFLYL